MDALESRRTLIIGGGFSGIGVAIALLERGDADFLLLEKSATLGGTWRENTYPGCACDVPSQLYSYSFETRADWRHPFAKQPEIQRYTLETARKYGVNHFVRHRTEVLRATWDEDRSRWRVETTRGEYEAQFLIAAQGPLHEPNIPPIPGLDAFPGQVFHSARWDHDCALDDARVAVVGTGSSAIQFIPEIQPIVRRLVLFQRTAPWVLPRGNPAIPARIKALLRLPPLRHALRSAIYGATELLQLCQRHPEVMNRLARLGEHHLRHQVRDPALRRALTPSFALGCKRMLFSNTYYAALTSPNATVVTGGLERVDGDAVIGPDGVRHEVDAIILATGFHVTDAALHGTLIGRGGVSMAEAWDGSPEAYLGTSVRGFPNAFLMLGPNLGNGHGSAFVIIEAQARYICDAIARARAQDIRAFDVRDDVQRTWNDRVQAALAGTVWNAGGCDSWYLDAKGRNSAIYPWTTIDLRRRLRRFDLRRFEVLGASP